MKIALGSDHAGFNLKETVKKYLDELNHTGIDFGCFDTSPVDYPDIGVQIAEAVHKGECQRGILFCGSGVGMDIVANKVPGIRAVLCTEPLTTRYARTYNDANVLCLGERIIGKNMACEIVRVFLTTEFAGERHKIRVDKISEVEKKYRGNERKGGCK